MIWRPLVAATIVTTVATNAHTRPPGLSAGHMGESGQQAILSGADVKRHVQILAHDSLEGRFPGTPGGERAARYLSEAFGAAGLRPLPTAPGFRQPVPLVGARTDYRTVVASARGARVTLTLPATDLLIRSRRGDAGVELAGEIVFAGHGIDAARHGWDDFAGVDLTGRLLAVFDGVPARARALLPGGGHSYYGEPEAKLRAAAARGALGIIFLPDPSEDSLRFRRRWNAERGVEHLSAAWDARYDLAALVWPSPGAASRLIGLTGDSLSGLATLANREGFRPLATGIHFQVRFSQRVRRFTAPNLVGFVPGTDAGGEAVLVTAHYDALGIGAPDASGDSIYNGAVDNASGTAALLELAEAVATGHPPHRTVVFLATTAEESDYDQIGARYYAEHPYVPLAQTVVNVNLDGISWRAPTDDYLVFPSAGIDADTVLDELAAPLGMTRGSTSWQDGMHFSFDTKEFLAHGIVGLTVWGGSRYRLDDPEHPPERMRRSTAIHAPADEYHEDWSETAIEQHLRLYHALLRFYADGGGRPRFQVTHPFAPLRDP